MIKVNMWRLSLRVLVVSQQCTDWCSEIGSLTSLDASNSGASSDVREPGTLQDFDGHVEQTSELFHDW